MRKAESEDKLSRILVIGYGNPGRLDDGLGPALAERLETSDYPGVTVDSDYQLIVEDAEVVSRHDAVIFIDASVNGPEPFSVERVVPSQDCSFSSHSVSPQQVLGMAEELFGSKTPGFIIGIRGYEFNEFEERLSEKAADNLQKAYEFLDDMLSNWDLNKLRRKIMSNVKRKILCIDDDMDILEILRMILEANDFEMVEASSAEEGLKKAREAKPDLILCDLMMEEVDAGTNFAKEMKAQGNDVPIYILSSVGDNLNLSMDFSQMGLAGILQKPIDPDKLVKMLRSKLND